MLRHNDVQRVAYRDVETVGPPFVEERPHVDTSTDKPARVLERCSGCRSIEPALHDLEAAKG